MPHIRICDMRINSLFYCCSSMFLDCFFFQLLVQEIMNPRVHLGLTILSTIDGRRAYANRAIESDNRAERGIVVFWWFAILQMLFLQIASTWLDWRKI
ncbi:unnamed protein product [Linum tenue]|uniref:Uncharacterized protein n=1 Tax=Linum tenue TaxID=586396 RepID=A0AAV0LFE2_9ROSI|nr:unnamed protein product [Linum tenue]